MITLDKRSKLKVPADQLKCSRRLRRRSIHNEVATKAQLSECRHESGEGCLGPSWHVRGGIVIALDRQGGMERRAISGAVSSRDVQQYGVPERNK